MARQKFGQHFLVDSQWKKKIVDFFQPQAAFAEIGPGQGAITKILSERFQGFYAFEIDESLRSFHENQQNYEVFFQDFLSWDFKISGSFVENFSLIGNLPYESGTQIILRVIENQIRISHFVFMLQKEVADRIAAEPGTRDFGSLSVLAQTYYDIKRSPKIPPEAFSPPPKVDSALIIGFRNAKGDEILSVEFKEFLKHSFQQKRKRLRNNLKSIFQNSRIDQVFDEMGFSPDIRAEEVGVKQWHQLFELFKKED